MTTQELVDYFSILQDKYGSPNLIEDEIVTMLNHAQSEYLNRLFPDTQGGVANVEVDSNTIAQVQPLIYTITGNMDSGGVLTGTVINTALNTATGGSDDTYFRVMSVAITVNGSKKRSRFVKQNNIWAITNISFKTPTIEESRHTLIANGIQFYPTDAAKTITLTVVKEPAKLALDPAVNPDFSDYSLYTIIMIALQLSGVSVRDAELIGAIQNISTQGK
jgi:hypothetical protein